MIADLETRLVTTEDRETQDRNLPKDPLIYHHQHQCARRKLHADSRLILIHSLHERVLVLSPRKWTRHRPGLQRAEVEEVVAMICLPSLMLAIFSSLQAALEEPLIRRCKIRTTDA